MWIGHRQVADLRERETPGLRIGQLPRERWKSTFIIGFGLICGVFILPHAFCGVCFFLNKCIRRQVCTYKTKDCYSMGSALPSEHDGHRQTLTMHIPRYTNTASSPSRQLETGKNSHHAPPRPAHPAQPVPIPCPVIPMPSFGRGGPTQPSFQVLSGQARSVTPRAQLSSRTPHIVLW